MIQKFDFVQGAFCKRLQCSVLSMRSFFLIVLLVLLAGCGYHFSSFHEGRSSLHTLTVPYIEGDKTGDLTSAVIREASSSGLFEVRSSGGEVILKIKIIESRDENIGFRYDRNQNGTRENTLIPIEMRISALAEVSLLNGTTNCLLLGPVRISASAEFDHDYYFDRDGVNQFSLGQLVDIDTAKETAQHPLHRVLAQKIIDFISNAW